MKRCVIEATPDALRAILGLPDGAIVDGIGYSDKLGVIELRVSGFGQECAEGARIERAITMVQRRQFDGENWYQSTAQMLRSFTEGNQS